MTMKIMVLALTGLLYTITSWADSDVDFKYKKTQVKGDITMLHGAGGNIAVLNGKEGLLIVDNGFADNSDQLDVALNEYENKPRFVFNTHWHGDHVGANALLSKGATILAHHNVRTRLENDSHSSGKAMTSVNENALPDLTYEQDIKLHFSDQIITAVHYASGHTDGDTVVFFEPAHVVHMGDLMFAGSFPFIDLSSGGSVSGYIKNVAQIISELNESSVIIPGHGRLSKLKDLETFHQMLEKRNVIVATMKQDGMTLEQAKKKGLSSEWASWGKGFIGEGRWIETLWKGLE